MGVLRPGKGAHWTVTREVLDFLQSAIEDIWNSVGEPDDEDGVDQLIDSDNAITFLKNVHGSAVGWKQAKDKFGIKLYKETEWGTGAYRVTLVLNSRGELKIDIREWFDPDDESSKKAW